MGWDPNEAGATAAETADLHEQIASLRAQLASCQESWNLVMHNKLKVDAQLASRDCDLERADKRVIALAEQLDSAKKALEGVYDHMDRNGMANWPVAKRVRKELEALTNDGNGSA
jgi:predicted trehalose synthase